MTSSLKRKFFCQNFFFCSKLYSSISHLSSILQDTHSWWTSGSWWWYECQLAIFLVGARGHNICSCTTSQKIKILHSKYWSRTWQIITGIKALKFPHIFCCSRRNQFCDKIDWHTTLTQGLHLMERIQESYKIATIFIWWNIICKITTEFFWYPPVGTEKFPQRIHTFVVLIHWVNIPSSTILQSPAYIWFWCKPTPILDLHLSPLSQQHGLGHQYCCITSVHYSYWWRK